MIGNGFFEFDKPKTKKPASKKKTASKKKPAAAAAGPASTKEKLASKTVEDLYKMAKSKKIDGRSKMKKAQLVTALCRAMSK